MSTTASPATLAAAAAPATAARREIRHIVLLLASALAGGAALQLVFPPSARGLVVTAAGAAALTLVVARVVPGRLRETLTGFRFAAASIAALGAAAALGTLVVQNQPADHYLARYGAMGGPILALQLDNVFHSLWLGALMGLFAAALVSSGAARLPPRPRTFGLLLVHAGLLTVLCGAAASAAFTTRGRLDLRAGGESATHVRVTGGGAATALDVAPLGFELRLDRFDVVNHQPELRVAYYEPAESEYRLVATFSPEVGVAHALPGGNTFRVARLDLDAAHGGRGAGTPAAVLDLTVNGESRETPVLFALREGSNYVRVPAGVLRFERRPDEPRSFVSRVTITDGEEVRQASIGVNEPLSFGGWTLYQAAHDPRDPTYSGLDAVRDPGAATVFAGLALLGLGVVWSFYGERLVRGAPGAASARARASAAVSAANDGADA